MIPLEKPHEALMVPAGAIMRHENQPFVFVPRGRAAIPAGRCGGGAGDERAGGDHVRAVRPGDAWWIEGTFYLKSELLLEREE